MAEDVSDNVYPVLLAGGTGTRLWPVSRQLYPKQLVKFVGDGSLIQNTITRLTPIVCPDHIRIVCGAEHFYEIARQMKEAGLAPEGKIVSEPCGRNTAPAILLAMFNILETGKDAVCCVFPADHVIKDVRRFQEKVKSAVKLAEKGYIVTFGIKPHYPETSYGYIEGDQAIFGEAFTVKRFVEKPDKATAVQYIKAGNFFWNSGMFTFKLSVMMAEFNRFLPQMYQSMKELLSRNTVPGKRDYEKLPNISIDYAIMEKTDRAAVLPSDFGWSDIGSWKSLFDFLPKDHHGNVIDGDVIAKDTANCFILGQDRLIATNHIENMVVVDTPDSVFISDIDNSRDVKSIVSLLKETGRKEWYQHITVFYSWGNVTGLEQGSAFGVDRITIFPGSTLNLSEYPFKAVHFTIAAGRVIVSEKEKRRDLNKGESFDIPDPSSAIIHNPDDVPANLIAIRFQPG